MAMELIDGFAGTPHIDSADLAALNQGCFGPGDYVFEDYGEALAATMTTANSVTIGTGALVHEGRRAVNLASESLTVQTGAQGQKRNDIVAARYARDDGSGVESMELMVLKGTPVSYGDAIDPELDDGDMALWRIPIDGITPGNPVKLFDGIPSIVAIRDSVSHDTGWVAIWQTSDSQIVAYRMVGRSVCMRWNVLRETNGYWKCPIAVPAAARPARDVYAAAAAVSSSYFALNTCAMAFIGSNGEFGLQAAAAQTGAHVCGTASWLV